MPAAFSCPVLDCTHRAWPMLLRYRTKTAPFLHFCFVCVPSLVWPVAYVRGTIPLLVDTVLTKPMAPHGALERTTQIGKVSLQIGCTGHAHAPSFCFGCIRRANLRRHSLHVCLCAYVQQCYSLRAGQRTCVTRSQVCLLCTTTHSSYANPPPHAHARTHTHARLCATFEWKSWWSPPFFFSLPLPPMEIQQTCTLSEKPYLIWGVVKLFYMCFPGRKTFA